MSIFNINQELKKEKKENTQNHFKTCERKFFASEVRCSSNFENLMINENIVREEQQASTSSQNQTETITEPKQSSSDINYSEIISMYEVKANYIFIFFSILFAT